MHERRKEMVQVKVTQDYFDREQDKLMIVDDQFECSQERAELLTMFGVAEIVSEGEEIIEETEVTAEE
jgi:hypothetical protein